MNCRIIFVSRSHLREDPWELPMNLQSCRQTPPPLSHNQSSNRWLKLLLLINTLTTASLTFSLESCYSVFGLTFSDPSRPRHNAADHWAGGRRCTDSSGGPAGCGYRTHFSGAGTRRLHTSGTDPELVRGHARRSRFALVGCHRCR